MKKNFYYLILILFIASCATKNPHKATEKEYNAQINTLKETISTKEAVPLKSESFVVVDSIAYRYKNQLLNYKDTLSKTDTKILQNGIVSEWVGTVNFNLRKPNFIIIHHTAQDSVQQTLKTFTLKETKVSAHYVIARDGKVIHMLNDYLRAWHAGNSSWGKDTDINSSSIGIELDNNGSEPFSDLQINTLLALLTKLKKDYNIPTQNIIGHADIAPTRKKDPSALFPWKLLALNGFGVWPDETLLCPPSDFNAEQGLQIIGYNTTNLSAAIIAFKLHYIQNEVNDVLDEKTVSTIYSIYKK
ncbi:N-acetylmuramoyl-L-alanine amidase [Flavobacterium taihuense]|uniref:N-acetylmuramoyl-L-alanine amidase n=1 Tax=Flavobacterium taihuense TaxID=2857508 RepID=A0ABS6XVX3_9FLAO|nr:N-acetylmuramoyl-L-alanine amidase [Flavobacterium taihuense]MBW4360833.1 N-acetylmuramoyl-L-alanine amidase [Flavobacterium taihuense]